MKEFLEELKVLCEKYGITMGGGGGPEKLVVTFRKKRG